MRRDIRNFAIVAHIDHGKTTLVDAMLNQSGVFRENQDRVERVMDNNDQERERGITILAKNTSVMFGDVKLNILDTPGHADFGGEVERVLTLADGVLLLVDASEGPLPQTRFVLSKALGLGLQPIVVINKIDRGDARPAEVLDEVYDLFIELGADEEQLEFPVIYAIGRDGIAKRSLEEQSDSLKPLFEAVVEKLPGPPDRREEPLQVLVANTEYDDFLGRIAIGRIVAGSIKKNQTIHLLKESKRIQARATKLYSFAGLNRVEAQELGAGDIMALAGLEEVEIGDTVVGDVETPALERIRVDPPTLRMTFMVNNSPVAGKDGKYVTSRQIRDRLMKAAEQNVAIRVADTDSPDRFDVAGRGELQLAVLAETLRREGYELGLSKPVVVTQEDEDGNLMEPMERVTIDVPEDFIGTVTEKMSNRKGQMLVMSPTGNGRTKIEYRIPSRGLIGYRSEFLTDTRGTGIMNTLFDGWAPHAGRVARRPTGAMVSDRKGTTTPYALFNLQPRGKMLIRPGTEVYEGMIVGEHARENDLDVNVCREKKLTNIRAAGKDEAVVVTAVQDMSLEEAIEFIDEDELVEVTPKAIRLRKKELRASFRPKRNAS